MGTPTGSKDVERTRELYCPSAAADDEGALVFGLVAGTADAPEIAYLERPLALTPELRALAQDLDPGEVFRTTSRCSEGKCHYYSGSHCKLAAHLVETLEPVAEALPACAIRAQCRWFAEERGAACLRCPQVVTQLPMEAATQLGPEGQPKRRRLPIF